MIDERYLKKVKLVSAPVFQRLVGHLFLTPNYHWFSKVEINIHGLASIPRHRNVIFAMNHTDRFNYWPFQYKLWRLKGFPYTTVWVKGAYYRNRLLAAIFNLSNAIPVPSMKYLIEEGFSQQFGRRIEPDEYRTLKDLVDGKVEKAQALAGKSRELTSLLQENFLEFVRKQHDRAMKMVAELSISALREKNLNLIIFPEGTRSVRLGRGRTGLAQLALKTETPIVPVGCSNSEKVYPGNSPVARSGRVTYRVGPPLEVKGALKPFRIEEPFQLFSRESRERHEDRFEAATLLIMEKINHLVDVQYQTDLPQSL